MRKYGESKTTRIMMATVPHVTSGSGLTKFQADGFLLDRVYVRLPQPFAPQIIGRGAWPSEFLRFRKHCAKPERTITALITAINKLMQNCSLHLSVTYAYSSVIISYIYETGLVVLERLS